MDRTIAMLCIGLIFGGGIGFTVAAGNGITFDGHDHADPSHHQQTALMDAETKHQHGEMLVLKSNEQSPSIEISARPDGVSGWNLNIKTSNFRFAPENASRAHVTGEGHAHIYINDVKIARVYGSWFHIDQLKTGINKVTVTLNTNDHRQIAVDGKPLSVSMMIDAEDR